MTRLSRTPSTGSMGASPRAPSNPARLPVARAGSQRSAQAISTPKGAVLVLGEALFDCLADQKGVPRKDVKSWTPYPGGAPANVAAALGKLGTKVGFITAFGNDELAEKMKKLLESRNVDLSGSQYVDLPTRDVLVVFDNSGDREFIGFGSAEANQFADCYISAAELPQEAVQEAAFLVTGTLGLAYPDTGKAMQRAVDIAKTGPCSVLIDINWRPVFFEEEEQAKAKIFPYVQKGDILKMSDEEAEWLYGISRAEALKHPEKVLEAASEAKGVLVTAGEQGSSYAFHKLDRDGIFSGHIPVFDVKVEDTTGAGDAFLGGFLNAMIKAGGLQGLQSDEQALRDAVEFASACGAFTTTQPGGIDAQPSEEQATDLLNKLSAQR